MPELPTEVAHAFRAATDSLGRFLKERSEDARTACLHDYETLLAEIQAAADAEEPPGRDWSPYQFHAQTVIDTVSRLP